MPDGWCGYSHFDVLLRMDAEDLGKINLSGLIEKVNQRAECAVVQAVYPLVRVSKAVFHKYVWRFETPLAKSLLVDKFSGYSGNMKMMGKSGMMVTVQEKPYPKDALALYMVQEPKSTVGFFVLEEPFNPFFALWSMFGNKLPKTRQLFSLERVASFEEAPVVCQSCKNMAAFDVLRNTPSRVCPPCYSKLMAVKMLKAKQG